MSGDTMMVRPAFVCGRCGGPVKGETLCGYGAYMEGLRIDLDGGVGRFTCMQADCGALGHVVADEHHLAARLAQARLQHPVRLGGPEGRFVRRLLDLTQRDLAARLEIAHVYLSRWERGEEFFSPALEMRLRLVAATALQVRHPGFAFDWPALAALKLREAAGERPAFRFAWTLGGWRQVSQNTVASAAA